MRRFLFARSSSGQICNAICARARVYRRTRHSEQRVCMPACVCVCVCLRVQRGHANIVLKRNRASELHGGARGKAREASKSKSERVTVGDPAAGCRQHSYNTTRPARPTHRAQYTGIRTHARVRTSYTYNVGLRGITALGSRDNRREDGRMDG